ncbi:MAG: polysaccharide biosynthesis tyrosine autokinase [Arenicellales bacterium]
MSTENNINTDSEKNTRNSGISPDVPESSIESITGTKHPGEFSGELVFLSPDSKVPVNYLPVSKKRIGDILVEQGKLTQEEVDRILDKQENNKGYLFGEAAIELNIIGQEELDFALSIQFGYPVLPVTGKTNYVDLEIITDPSGQRAEEIRELRSNLILQWFDNDRKTLAVVCSEKDEGRSYTIASLAVAFAQLGKRTLLIDANLRSPQQYKIFNLPRSNGLSTILTGRKNECLPYQVNAVPSLFVLPSGPVPPNPQELISQPAFKMLLSISRDKFDIVLVDTPGADEFADAELIATSLRGVLLVVEKGVTKERLLKELIERLKITDTKIAGCVLT